MVCQRLLYPQQSKGEPPGQGGEKGQCILPGRKTQDVFIKHCEPEPSRAAVVLGKAPGG